MDSKSSVFQSIFDVAAEFESAKDREAYLDNACGDDEELKKRLRELLEYYENADSFIDVIAKLNVGKETNRTNQSVDNPSELLGLSENAELQLQPGSFIGPYRLKEKLGSGGFGVVYLAEQLAPVKRDVALKLIKPGMDSAEVLSRFNSERQAMAIMSHDAIAKIFDAGVTEQGRPYFAMEFIDGIPITEYCDMHRFSIRQRLELMVQVCEGVQHAHLKGVIHRDLKPTNILVNQNSGKIFAKIIDFGVAKSLIQTNPIGSIDTLNGQWIGTPLYMSPEQAASGQRNVDIRSDIYSLGVILFELLSGTTPIEKHELAQLGPAEIISHLQQPGIVKPSQRVRIGEEDGSSIAVQRSTTPSKLRSSISGDLDWIVVKALQTEPHQRFESASALAKDISRFLDGTPIQARPPSQFYRFQKFVFRNKIALAFGSLFLIVLVGATVFSSWQAALAKRSETKARVALAAETRAKRNEIANREAAVAAQIKAEESLKSEALQKRTLQRFSEFMNGLFRLPASDRMGSKVTVAQVMNRAEKMLPTVFKDEPETRVMLYTAVGNIYKNIGLYREATPMIEGALRQSIRLFGEADEKTRDLMLLLSNLYRLDRNPNAQIQFERNLKLINRIVELEKQVPDNDVRISSALHDLGICYRNNNQIEKAANVFESCLEMSERMAGPESISTFETLILLGDVYRTMGQLEKSITLLERAKSISDRKYPRRFLPRALCLKALAYVYAKDSRVELAVELLTEVLQIESRALGMRHPRRLRTLAALASNQMRIDDMDNAKKNIDLGLSVVVERPREVLLTITFLELAGDYHVEVDDLPQAQAIFEQLLEKHESEFESKHPIIVRVKSKLNKILASQ